MMSTATHPILIGDVTLMLHWGLCCLAANSFIVSNSYPIQRQGEGDLNAMSRVIDDQSVNAA